MRVFKNTYTKEKNGVRVKIKTKNHYGRLKKATGETVLMPLLKNKHASEAMLASLQLEQDQIRAGVLPTQGNKEKKSLLAFVDSFVKHLAKRNGKSTVKEDERNGKSTVKEPVLKGNSEEENSKGWSGQQGSKLKLVFGNSKFVYHTDVTKEILVDILDKLKDERGWGNQTYNHYVKALNAFFNWLVKENYIPRKPYKEIELEDTGKDDLVHGRRAFSNEEFKFLIESVENDKSKRHGKISKVDRINLYQIIFYTGLRAEELYQLKPECFDFSSRMITFIAGKTRKNKSRKDTLPLHPDLILKIKEWVLAKEKNKMLWNCWDSQYFGTLLKKDMVRARDRYVSSALTGEEKNIREQDDFLKWEDRDSLFADLHALRTTFITNVSKVASPKQCQELARHASMETSYKYYVKTTKPELAVAIGKLPTLN